MEKKNNDSDIRTDNPELKPTFFSELTTLINKHSEENDDDTIDWILGDYIVDSIYAYKHALKKIATLNSVHIDLSRGDLYIGLRKTGHGNESIVITSDEGDGYSFLKTGDPVFDEKDLENWIGQLEHVVDYMKTKFNK